MTDPYLTRRDIERKKSSRWKHFERWRDIIVATVFAVDGSITVPNKPDYVWIHEWGSEYSYAQALRSGITVTEGMPVMVTRDPKEPFNWKIIGVYTGALDPGTNNSIIKYQVGAHGENHQIPTEDNAGLDPVKIWNPAYMPLKAEGNGSDLDVVVWGEATYWYNSQPNIFPGNVVDMTPYLPSSGNTKYALLYLDVTDGFIKVADGVEVTIGSTPPYPSLPTNSVPSAIVQLTYGQTSITTATDIIDARGLYSGGSSDYSNIMVDESGNVMTDSDTGTVMWE